MAKLLLRTLDRLVDTLVAIVCILLLLIGVYSMLDNLWLYQNASDKSLLNYKPPLEQVLTPERKITEQQVAWLSVYDTDIDYPVLQGEDNFEYLNKNPYGEFSLSGSIFLDARNDPLFRDDYSLIYGHHMAHGTMFGALDSFCDRSYFDTHRHGVLTTPQAVYQIELFAVSYAEGTDPLLFDPRDRTTSEIDAFLSQNAMIYQAPAAGRRWIALTTCTDDASNKRLLVFGTLKKS